MAKKSLIQAGKKPAAPKRPKPKKKVQGRRAPKRAAGKRNTRMGGIRIRRVAVAKINAAVYNPRVDLQPGDPEYEAIARSIATFGYVDPLVWNERSGVLVGGHQRFKILVAVYGVTDVDVSVVDLSPAEEKALNVALNKTGGAWDRDKLTELMIDLSADASIDATVTGFSDTEIEAMLDSLPADGVTPEGDQGDHTIHLGHSYKVIVECRDADEQNAVVGLMKRKKIACHTRTNA